MELDNTATAPSETPLARLIREQGRVKGWVASQLGIGPDRLSRLISGQARIRLSEALKLAELFNVPIETFVASGED